MNSKNLQGKSILVVAGDYPYPPNHGMVVDIWNRILILEKIGLKIDLICTVKGNTDSLDKSEIVKHVNHFWIVNRKNRVIDLLSKETIQVKSRVALSRLVINQHYDYLLLEADYVAEILNNKTITYDYAILRSHNNEGVYYKNLGESTPNIFKKFYYFSESFKFNKTEPALLKKVKNVLFVSMDEKKRYDKQLKGINTLFLPPVIKLETKLRQLNNKTVLFIGSLYIDNNREGIQYYIKNVHPYLSQLDGYKFILAGNTKHHKLQWVDDILRTNKDVTFYDTPDDLEPLYARASVFLNPMLHGAGVKLKTVEAIVNGLPVVCFPTGIEGTGLQQGIGNLTARNAEEMRRYFEKLLTGTSTEKQDIVRKGQKFITKNYDAERLLSNFLSSL
jgi:hypothetical protein